MQCRQTGTQRRHPLLHGRLQEHPGIQATKDHRQQLHFQPVARDHPPGPCEGTGHYKTIQPCTSTGRTARAACVHGLFTPARPGKKPAQVLTGCRSVLTSGLPCRQHWCGPPRWRGFGCRPQSWPSSAAPWWRSAAPSWPVQPRLDGNAAPIAAPGPPPVPRSGRPGDAAFGRQWEFLCYWRLPAQPTRQPPPANGPLVHSRRRLRQGSRPSPWSRWPETRAPSAAGEERGNAGQCPC